MGDKASSDNEEERESNIYMESLALLTDMKKQV